MTGSTFGKLFKVSTWGESHGEALGCIIEGVPSKIKITEKFIQKFLERRKPGQSKYTTQRKEGDKVKILSGVFDGVTTGTPISLIIYNQDTRSKDYEEIRKKFRPGHSDFTYLCFLIFMTHKNSTFYFLFCNTLTCYYIKRLYHLNVYI